MKYITKLVRFTQYRWGRVAQVDVVTASGSTTKASFDSFIHSIKASRTDPGAHPASYSMGTGGSFLRGKVTGREINRSPPFRAEVKNEWRYMSCPPCAFIACAETLPALCLTWVASVRHLKFVWPYNKNVKVLVCFIKRHDSKTYLKWRNRSMNY
jgi:hypothetical protein